MKVIGKNNATRVPIANLPAQAPRNGHENDAATRFTADTLGCGHPVNALLTDLYELNMSTSYLRRGMTGTATFSLFVRSLPAARGFLVAAGIESCLDRIQHFRFEEDDIRYLRDPLRYEPRDLDAFRRLRFTRDIWAIPEGR